MKRSLIVGFALAASMLLACGSTPLPEAKQMESSPSLVLVLDVATAPKRELQSLPTVDKYENEGAQDKQPHVMYYKESDIVMLAKLMYQECGGVLSDTEKACVPWTVLNRVDEYDKTISEVITAKDQFAYYESKPVDDALYKLAEDVLIRWNNEKNGEDDVGRVLPRDYLWFSGDGEHNHFRNAYKGHFSTWDYSLETPYES